MTKRLPLLLLLLVLGLPMPLAAFTPETFTGKVVGVRDGDSIVVLRDRRRVEVRLNGVDAPERGQAFGSRARKFTLATCLNLTVTVRALETDRYGRLVADVTLPDGASLNREIVRAGHAWWYRRYSTDETLGRLEEEARAARRGLWADRDPIPPWEFRRRREETSRP